MTSTSNGTKLIGLLLGSAAALIGGSWQVLTRLATTSTTDKLNPIDLALLRYAIPALLLLPILRRGGLWPRDVSKPALLFVLVGAGLPFGLVAMSGTRFAPAAHMGVLMAGASPLIAAVLAWVIWRERAGGWRALGLAAMAVGVGLLGARSLAVSDLGSTGTWRGDALFLLAAMLWAGYSLAFRRSGLAPWQGAALVSVWSTLLVLPLWIWSAAHHGSSLIQVAPQTLLFNAVFQGLVAGLLGLWTISAAIVRLGAAQAAAFGALAPVVSAVGCRRLVGSGRFVVGARWACGGIRGGRCLAGQRCAECVAADTLIAVACRRLGSSVAPAARRTVARLRTRERTRYELDPNAAVLADRSWPGLEGHERLLHGREAH